MSTNMPAIDAWFFGASACTEAGLNTRYALFVVTISDMLGSIDVKGLKTYQQLYIFFIPILNNLGFINCGSYRSPPLVQETSEASW